MMCFTTSHIDKRLTEVFIANVLPMKTYIHIGETAKNK